MTDIDGIVREILREGLDDWVPVDTLLWYVRQESPAPEESFKATFVETIRYLLSEGLMLVGEIGESGFEPWPGTVSQIIERLVAACDAVSWTPFGSVCWLSNTSAGSSRI
ncbi:hypothetical protein ACFZB9_14610 [Kitasatospora sp. NPDC008050]|uniref:hypothetical protein n=1 Tax=Kitasatospora sp. NPDC008050 TaxID=3364021 RepID=UPI0036E700A2